MAWLKLSLILELLLVTSADRYPSTLLRPRRWLTALAAVALIAGATLAVGPAATADEVIPPPIDVGEWPTDVAFTHDSALAYVTVQGDNEVAVIDVATGSVIDTIVVGNMPTGIEISPDGSTAYVTNQGDHTLSAIDIATNTVTDTWSTGGTDPYSLAISPDGAVAYVAHTMSHNVTVLNLTNGSLVGSPITVGSRPYDIALTPDGAVAYVANRTSHTVSIINTAIPAVLLTMPVGNGPGSVAISPDGTVAYVVNYIDNTVTVINAVTHTLAGVSIAVGDTPYFVDFTPDGSTAYVGNYADETLSVIDVATHTVTGVPIPVGNETYALTITPDGTKIYIANVRGTTVTVVGIDVAPTITSGAPPAATAGEPYSFTVTASGFPAPTFAITDGALPPGFTLDPDTGEISGTSTAAGNHTFTISAENAAGTDEQEYVLSLGLAATGADDAAPLLLLGFGLLLVGVIAVGARRRLNPAG